MIRHHLREIGNLCTYSVVGTQGPLGTLSGLVFDPENWRIRYFVITRDGMPREPVIVPTQFFCSIDDDRGELGLDVADELLRSAGRYRPGQLAASKLFDAAALIGQTIDGCDRPAGEIADLLVNVDVWQLRYFVIEAASRRVLTDIEWCSSFDDGKERLSVDLPAEAVAMAPPYPSLAELCSGFEEALYRHYTSRTYAQQSGVA